MFTGIIQKTAKVLRFERSGGATVRLEIENSFHGCDSVDPIQLGESIATNGVCLTVVQMNSKQICFDLAPETLKVTALSNLKPGKRVNLERAMK